ncbi:hypothetical protein Y032_0013g1959 [Ancylostoma ceylanicum]|uniref:Uncharacterized protein n=1 Tax=Ancylostoma ceylanicum TaxID=53326 RepID=A0A016VC24_9BILA|nr:hypothetical protein Y032_0013g1959 [Ancylostoma ceylanicum]
MPTILYHGINMDSLEDGQLERIYSDRLMIGPKQQPKDYTVMSFILISKRDLVDCPTIDFKNLHLNYVYLRSILSS